MKHRWSQVHGEHLEVWWGEGLLKGRPLQGPSRMPLHECSRCGMRYEGYNLPRRPACETMLARAVLSS